MMRKVLLMFLVASPLLSGAIVSDARGSVTLDLAVEFSGGAEPTGTAPWLTATFTDVSSDTVHLELSAVNLVGNEYVSAWFFNLDPDLDPAQLVIDLGTAQKYGTFGDPIVSTGIDAFKADGDGFFDIKFVFANAKAQRFGAGEVYSGITISYAGPGSLSEQSFSFESAAGGGNSSFSSAAHVKAIASAGDSGWIGAESISPSPNPQPPIAAPEPASLAAWGLLAALAGTFAFKRRRRQSLTVRGG